MNRTLSPLLLLLFILSGFPAGAQPSDPAAAPDSAAWTITDLQTCSGTLVVDRNITVEDGGTLDLQGCTLQMDSPPYENQVFPAHDEGLVIAVKPGGSLRLHAAGGAGSAIERADARYGYTIKVEGHFESVGAPGAWNRIEGIEGAHQSTLALGGLQVHQDATVRYTTFRGNSGPSPFLLYGSTFDGDQMAFENASFMASNAARVAASNFTLDDSFSGPSLSTVANARLGDCSIRAGLVGLYAAVENLTVQRCRIESPSVAVQVVNARLHLGNSTLHYGRFGLQAGVKGKFASSPNRLFLDRTTVQPLDGAAGANATDALTAAQAQVVLSHSTLVAGSGAAINASGGSFTLTDSHLRGAPAFKATDPWSGSTIPAEQLEGPTPRAIVLRQTLVTVNGTDGAPLANATVTVAGTSGMTDAHGRAPITWTWASGDGVVIGPYTNRVPVTVSAPGLKKVVHLEMPADRALYPVSLEAKHTPSPAWVALLAVAAVAVAVRRRRDG